MVGSIKIRVHAHNPSLPLTEAVSYIGSPSSVFVYDVPKKIGTWQITDVAVSVYYPDNSFATVAARVSAEGVWVATIPACDLSGRIRNGFRILASGIDEDGEPVSGYVLGVGDLAVCKLFPAPAPDPGEKAYILRYFDTAPESPKKGDVAPIDDAIKFYDGTQWVAFGSDVDLSDYYTKEETDALFDDYYTAEETDEAIDRLAAYYITYNAAGAAFPTRAALLNAQTVYSGGVVRTPTRNDYAVVLADESHDGAEYRYIYAVADGQTVGQWEAQYPIETNDYAALSHKPQINGFELTGNKSATDLNLVKANDGESSRLMLLGGVYNGYQYGIRVLTSSGADIQIEIRKRDYRVADAPWLTVGTQTLQKTTGTVALQGDIRIDGITVNGVTMPITNKVVDIPVPVVIAPSTAATAEGKSADAKATGDALAGKVAKSGDTMTGGLTFNTNATTALTANADIHLYDQAMLTIDDGMALGEGSTADYLATQIQHKPDGANDYYALQFPEASGKIAIAASNPTAGNLAALDANGNATDSGIAPSDIPTEADFHYALGQTITASATLADRTMNKVEPLATNTTDIELSFPAATNGKARDFLVLINNPTGNTGTITFTPPPGVTIYGDGLQQTFAAGETWEVTITEVAQKQFYCKAVKMEATVVPPYWGLTFTAEQANSSVTLGTGANVSLQTSTDGGGTWTPYTLGTAITLANVGDSVCFAATDGVTNGRINPSTFTMTGLVAASGDISSLLKNDQATASSVPVPTECFVELFSGCTSLTAAPELPAMTLGGGCYYAMFRGCTSLTAAPDLPATTMVGSCYAFMFDQCGNITRGPVMSATAIPEAWCLERMFQGCGSINSIEVAWTNWGPEYGSWMWLMSAPVTGTFKCPAALGDNSTIARGSSYCPSGWTVVNV